MTFFWPVRARQTRGSPGKPRAVRVAVDDTSFVQAGMGRSRRLPRDRSPGDRGIVLRVGQDWELFFHRAERQHDFAKDFVQHLRQSGVNCGEAAEHSFVAGEMFEAGAGVGEIADGQ